MPTHSSHLTVAFISLALAAACGNGSSDGPNASGADAGTGGAPADVVRGGGGGATDAVRGGGGATVRSNGGTTPESSAGTPATPPAGGHAPTGGTTLLPSGSWRPFHDDSPWNTPIGDDPVLDPNSAELIADFESSSEYGEHLDVNIPSYSVPLFWADGTTPKLTVTCELGGIGFESSDGFNATAEVPMPQGAAPDPESDHHLLIVDRSTNTEYGFFNARNSGGSWTCSLGAVLDLNGDGVRPLAEFANPWWEAHGPRACGFGLVAGLIRPEELEAGVIDHALIVAYPHIRSGFYTSPASTAQASNGAGAEPDRGIPCGGRIQYDPSIDLDGLEVSDAGRAVLRALQIYGAYVGDYSGAISLYGDNSPDAVEYYESIGFDSYELLDVIDLADFRVIQSGPVYDNGNG